LRITREICHRTTLWTVDLVRLMEGTLFPSKHCWLWKGELGCVVYCGCEKEPVMLCSIECQASNVTATVQSGHRLHGYTLSVFSPPRINRIVHHYVVLKFSPCLTKPLPQLVRIADWYLVYTYLHHAPDAVINQVEVRAVGWPHVRTDELGCLTAQKLDCVTSTMCWRALSCWKTNTSPAMLWIAGSSSCVSNASR